MWKNCVQICVMLQETDFLRHRFSPICLDSGLPLDNITVDALKKRDSVLLLDNITVDALRKRDSGVLQDNITVDTLRKHDSGVLLDNITVLLENVTVGYS